MWWIYFNIGAERGSRHIAASDDPGRLARIAYTYLHLPIVAGIVVAAVGDELVLAHPTGHTNVQTAAVLLGGPALYLLGNVLFKRASAKLPAVASGRPGAAGAAGSGRDGRRPLMFSGATALVLVIVAIWEHAVVPAEPSERARLAFSC